MGNTDMNMFTSEDGVPPVKYEIAFEKKPLLRAEETKDDEGIKMNENRQYFMVRAQQSDEEDFEVFFNNDVVAVGWSRVNFSEFADAEALRDAVTKEYYPEGSSILPRLKSKYLNETERFKKMAVGDRVIVPHLSNIAIAEVLDEEIFSSKDEKRDLCNQRRVAYLKDNNGIVDIPRNQLTGGLQRRLRAPGGTILDLYEFKKEIDTLFETKNFSLSTTLRSSSKKAEDAFKKELLLKIQNGKTYLQSGGQGLEELVCELLICEGYEAEILGKQTFVGKADADVVAIRSDSFGYHRVLAQVKHHTGYSDDWGVNQLKKALADSRYEDCQGWFITSAAVNEAVRNKASEAGIFVMDGNGLVNLIYDHLDNLSLKTKQKLTISGTPVLLD